MHEIQKPGGGRLPNGNQIIFSNAAPSWQKILNQLFYE
jgi:hypothetical protein